MTVGAAVEGGVILVDRWFFRVAFKCPFAVASDFGRNFRTASAVRPGHVAKKLLSMAFVQVETDGQKLARCKKSMSSVFVLRA